MDDSSYVERLAHDVAVWKRDGLISDEQERAILARIGAGEPRLVGALRMGWLITAVSIIGAIILGAGVVLLFAANWREMPDWFRTVVIFAGMAIAYGGGYLLTYRYGMDRIGGSLLLLGVLLYHAALFLFADIYTLPVTEPWYMLLAAVGTLPVAYAFGSRIVLLLGIADVVTFAAWWLLARYEDDTEAYAGLVAVGAVGVMLYAIGRLHGLRRALEAFGDIYVLVGALVSLTLVYIFSFDDPWRGIIDEGVESFAAPGIVYVAIAAAAGLVGIQWTLRERDAEVHAEAAILAALLAVAGIVVTWPVWTGYAIVFNGLFFLAAAGIVTRGYLRGDERYVNFGLLLVAIGVLTRYVDVFWSLLATSAFFIIGGVLLLALAFGLERLRRRLISGMESGPPSNDPQTGAPGSDAQAGAPALHRGGAP
jgi:uncharacterized membrane protein